MKGQDRRIVLIILSCTLLGAAVDFLFNGIVIGTLLHVAFTERWIFLYAPLDLAVAVALSNIIMQSRFDKFASSAVIAFFCGALWGHLAFVGARRSRVYMMDVDQKINAGFKTVLLRSKLWPQVLFVTSGKVEQELSQHLGTNQVPVVVAVVSDYGCDRTAVVSTVAGLDVKEDQDSKWAWQVDRHVPSTGSGGPGMEDQKFFWCKRAPKLKYLEGSPGVRFWENH